MPIMPIMKKLNVLLPKQEHLWSCKVFLKNYEARQDFPDKPSQNILRLFYVFT